MRIPNSLYMVPGPGDRAAVEEIPAAAGGAESGDIDRILAQMRPLLESAVNNNQVRALEESALAVIDDRAVAVDTLNSLVAGARSSVTLLVPPTRDALRLVGAALGALAARGPEETRVRILAPPELAGDRRLAELAGLLDGVEIRLAAGVRHAAAVMDQRVALIRPGEATVFGAEASVVRAPAVVRALYDIMMTAWYRAAPLAGYQRLQECLRRDSGARILRMLGEGYTDEVAARELDISVRTYRRRVADIMRLLGARSRFQAGVHASNAGLLRA
ncbi:helix-turn-helix transcriptional regulator [Streptomyces caatingaensis]|uniref:helix-turn-helix transcriptional regulator n=1 Tax=Streptomyces caatingaensis TaxID=1678637 RepID=UPI0006727FCA|nr:helix-turn-helix transcriptional regulator [Streptomyces caatingaensis]